VYLDLLDREIKRRERKDSFGKALYGSGLVVSAERTHVLDISDSLHKALENLPEQQKKVFRMNRELQMKPAEIAAHLNIPVGTIKNQLSAALREIRQHLVSSGYGPLSILYLQSLVSLLFF
jgi:RNA polymerase sigma-70 factor (ECF subfamily)